MKVIPLKTKPQYFELQLNNPEYCKHGYVAMGTKKRLDLGAHLV